MSDTPSGTPDSGAMPAVSVIIPAYNSAAYIGDALRSVLAQTYKGYEIIVINDGSPDTENLERELQRFPADLRYIKQENRGVAAARNAGLRLARGEFIAFLDSDDTWMPTFLEKQLALIERSNADLVYSDAMLFGDSPLAGQTFMKLQDAGGELTTERLLNTKVSLQTSTVLARKESVVRVGLFNESLRRGQDFELWFRLAKEGFRFACQDETLANHRIVESGLSGGTVSKLRRTLSVLEAIEARYALTPGENEALQFNKHRTLRELALEKGKENLLNGDVDGARRAFGEARKLRTGWKVALVAFGLVVAPKILCGIYQRRELKHRRPA